MGFSVRSASRPLASVSCALCKVSNWLFLHALLIVVFGPAMAVRAEFLTAGSDNLIVNGGFEFSVVKVPPGEFRTITGFQMPPWNISGVNIDRVHTGYWQASEGDFSIDLNGTGVGMIQQTIPVDPNGFYSLLFDLAGNPDDRTVMPIKDLRVRLFGVSGQDVFDFMFDTTDSTREFMNWREEGISFFSPTGNTITVEFESRTPGAFGPALDNVRLIGPPPIPEPATLTLFGIGALGLLGYRWRQRKRAA